MLFNGLDTRSLCWFCEYLNEYHHIEIVSKMAPTISERFWPLIVGLAGKGEKQTEKNKIIITIIIYSNNFIHENF